jgi:hypothetical protein
MFLDLLKKRIHRLRALGRKIKAERKLKKSGYRSWSHYKHNRDPDVERYANHIDDFYKGYPYIYACPNPNHYAYQHIADYGPGGTIYGFNEIEFWCHEKIRWNFRCDFHRVYENQWGKMELNDIGGYDTIFFAFKREQDFTHFLLRWA